MREKLINLKLLKISSRAEKAQFSPIRKFVPLLEKIKKKGIKVFGVHIGQPDLETPKEILKRIRNFKEKILAYAPSDGLPEIKIAWQKYFQSVGINLKREEIIVTTGGSEAILFALAAIANPGEEVIVFEPFYTNYNGYASVAGIKLVPLRTLAETGFHLPSKKEIEKKIRRKTKGIIICNPNNPTGTVYSFRELKMISELAKKYNLFILADETYREFVYDGEKHFSMMSFPEVRDRVIILDSISKRFSACGARIGCLASKNKKVIEAVIKFAQARLSSPTVEQLAIIPLLKNPKKYLKKIIPEYKKRRNVVLTEIKKIPEAIAVEPKGAFYLMVKILWLKNSDHFTEWLLTKFSYQKKTVLIAPGAGFYASKNLGKDEFRVAFVLAAPKLKKTVQILKKGLEKYRKNFKL